MSSAILSLVLPIFLTLDHDLDGSVPGCPGGLERVQGVGDVKPVGHQRLDVDFPRRNHGNGCWVAVDVPEDAYDVNFPAQKNIYLPDNREKEWPSVCTSGPKIM